MKGEKIDPEGHLVVDLGLNPQKTMEVAGVEDPEAFDIGYSDQLPDAMLIYVHPPATHPNAQPHALAFRGQALDKLMQIFYNVLFSAEAVPGQEESPDPFSLTKPTKKKITLH